MRAIVTRSNYVAQDGDKILVPKDARAGILLSLPPTGGSVRLWLEKPVTVLPNGRLFPGSLPARDFERGAYAFASDHDAWGWEPLEMLFPKEDDEALGVPQGASKNASARGDVGGNAPTKRAKANGARATLRGARTGKTR